MDKIWGVYFLKIKKTYYSWAVKSSLVAMVTLPSLTSSKVAKYILSKLILHHVTPCYPSVLGHLELLGM